MKQTLLTRMKILLNHGMKIQTIRAWGLFIQLLGSYALKNSKLINDMLKIPEHTFADHDPQLQIASQVFQIVDCAFLHHQLYICISSILSVAVQYLLEKSRCLQSFL